VTDKPKRVAIIGGGPAGLAAAEELLAAGAEVRLFDSMPSLGRKFLMAGKSGLNLTHSEPFETVLTRFGTARPHLEAALRAFTPNELRQWAAMLGVETFVGSSGRVFPSDFKAAPLLRAWLRRLRAGGLAIHVRHRWQGWTASGALAFETPEGAESFEANATILALGGASWPKLGSDGSWIPKLAARGVAIHPLRPANCGFDVAWSAYLRERFAGQPVKPVMLTFGGQSHRGEFVISQHGVEGSGIYALSAALRDTIVEKGKAVLMLDLAPDKDEARLTGELARPRGKLSTANHLRKAAGVGGVKAALLREGLPADAFNDPARLAAGIKALPLTLLRTRPIAEAISSAGGVAFEALDENFMLREAPGVFCAGEMLDWEAPTGGYLLTACFATGRAAGKGAARWLASL
jgi:uncharacterized flavoprotein (TIGR03862 family)